MSSIGAVAAFPSTGACRASTWALEGFTETLAQEVRQFGIDVTLIEPGGYPTDRSASSTLRSELLPAYQPFRHTLAAQTAAAAPAATSSVDAFLVAVDAEEPPRRLLLSGTDHDAATWS